MSADKIIERLEKLRGEIVQYDPTDFVVDLDAAIADIRGLLAEPVTVWVGYRAMDYGNTAPLIAFRSKNDALEWERQRPSVRRIWEEPLEFPDAPGGTDAR